MTSDRYQTWFGRTPQKGSSYANISNTSPSLGRVDVAAFLSRPYVLLDNAEWLPQHPARRDARRRSALRSLHVLSASASTDFKSAHDLTAKRDPRAVSSSSSSEAPTIFPGTGDPDGDLADEADEADDRGGVEATDPDDEDDDREGESEDSRCCDILRGAVSRRARFLGGDRDRDRVDDGSHTRVPPPAASTCTSSTSCPHHSASARAARSAGSAPRPGRDVEECSMAEAQSAHSSAPRSCARSAPARAWRCARGRCARTLKIAGRGASTARRSSRTARWWGDMLVVVEVWGTARHCVAAQTSAACGSRTRTRTSMSS
jgi:hypothetical protein